MPSRRGNGNPRSRAGKFWHLVVSLLLVSVITPLVFLAARLGNFTSSGSKEFSDGATHAWVDDANLNALQQIESLFPKEVLDVIKSNTDDSGPLSLNVIGRKDLSSSWVVEKPTDVSRDKADTFQEPSNKTENGGKDLRLSNSGILTARRGALDVHDDQETNPLETMEKPDEDQEVSSLLSLEQNLTNGETASA